jgi:hypothetical protein
MGDVVEPRREFIQDYSLNANVVVLLGLEESNFLRKVSNCAVGESNYRVIRDHKKRGPKHWSPGTAGCFR